MVSITGRGWRLRRTCIAPSSFLPHRPEAPLGDYPFVPLDRPDVVYVRLGPAPEWGLSGQSWEEMYRRYFEGRRAFAYEDEELRELDVTTAR